MAKKKRTPLHKSPPPKHAPPPKTLPSKPAGPSTTRKVPPDSSFSRSGQSIPRSIADPEEQTSVPSGGSDSGPSLAAEEFPPLQSDGGLSPRSNPASPASPAGASGVAHGSPAVVAASGSASPVVTTGVCSGGSPATPALGHGVAVQNAWMNRVHCSSKKMEKKGESFVLESGELCVEIPNSVIEKNQRRWESFIIAQFHGKAPTPGALHAITNSIWSNKLRNITVSKLKEKSFLIKIPCPLTRQKVLEQGMWHIENQAMFVAKWEPGLTPAIPELTAAPVWIDFHNVPPHFYSEEGLEHIAGLVGHPIVLHPNTASMSNLEVARVYTIIDPTKPLPEAVNVRFQSGETQRVLVTSPWLPPTCEHCNQVGHSIKRCPSAPITCSKCNSTAHHADDCPRSKAPPKEAEADAAKKKKKQKRKKSSSRKLPSLPGALEVDIGLDSLGSGSPPVGKEKEQDKGNTSPRSASPSKSPPPKAKSSLPVRASPTRSSSSSSEDSASTEAETSEYYSEEDSATSKEEEEKEYTTVYSKKKQKLLRSNQKKASAGKANSSRGKRSNPQ